MKELAFKDLYYSLFIICLMWTATASQDVERPPQKLTHLSELLSPDDKCQIDLSIKVNQNKLLFSKETVISGSLKNTCEQMFLLNDKENQFFFSLLTKDRNNHEIAEKSTNYVGYFPLFRALKIEDKTLKYMFFKKDDPLNFEISLTGIVWFDAMSASFLEESKLSIKDIPLDNYYLSLKFMPFQNEVFYDELDSKNLAHSNKIFSSNEIKIGF